SVEIDLQKFIDINPYFFTNKKYKQIMNYLKDNTILSSDKKIPFPKDELYRFKNDEYISKFLIPTEKIESIESMKSCLEKYGTVVIKPVNSSQGKNILILNKKGSNYLLGKNKEEKVLSENEFEEFFWGKINSNGYIVQKY